MFTGELQEVCLRLENDFKSIVFPMGSRNDNMGVVITSWGEIIRMHSDADNVHMVNNANKECLKLLQKDITGVKSMVQEVQTTLVQAGGQFVENNIEFSSVKTIFTKINTTLTNISKVVGKIGNIQTIIKFV